MLFIEIGDNFKEKHMDHDMYLNGKINNHSTKRYLVGDGNACRFSTKLYWIFALLGLALPYRWLILCSVGHVKYKIKKKVMGNDPLPPYPHQPVSPPSYEPPLQPMSDSSSIQEPLDPPDYETACLELVVENRC